MLIQFTVGNFRSFKEPATLSMVAAKLISKDPQIDENNTFQVDSQLSLLTSSVIYGANASGKSNLIKAFAFMRRFVLVSSKEPDFTEPINISPFILDSEFENQPSFFEVVFRINEIPYRYGFEITREKVISEWLFYSPHGREATLFVREEGQIDSKRAFKGTSVKPLTRANALFLSVAAQFNVEFANRVVNWFKAVIIINGIDDKDYRFITTRKFNSEKEFRMQLMEVIRNLDVGINEIETENVDIRNSDLFPKGLPKSLEESLLKELKGAEVFISIKTIHLQKCSESTSKRVIFKFDDESDGTQKLFYVLGPIIDSLSKGRVLIIDEIEARMHTLLTRKLISLFNSRETNPIHAQLIFATHDTNLLSNKLFRRDQIWFVEKDEVGASHLYSLAELRVRNNQSFEDDYLQGRYGGIPIFGELKKMVIDGGVDDEKEAE